VKKKTFFLTIFEWLNHTIEAQVVVPIDGFVFENEDEKLICLILGHPWKKLHEH
jgi:hypothetical protein